MRTTCWISVGLLLASSACAQPDLWEVPDNAWSIVVLPDTQYYARGFPDTFFAQTSWIRDHHEQLRMRAVLHVGDVVDDNSPEQWAVARDAMEQLDGVVPYVLAPGNHDFGTNGSSNTRDSLLSDFFPPEDAMEQPGFGGLYDAGERDNSWHVFDTSSGPYLVIALEFGPRDEVIDWAEDVLERHPGIPTILVTHAYLYSDDTRYDYATRPDQLWSPYHYGLADPPATVNDGEEIFRRLVEPFDQVDLVFCGHVLNDGVGRLTSEQAGGGIVHQVLADYQVRESGGEGYLRVVTFHDGTVHVRTYSPVLDQFLGEPDHEFTLPRP